LATIATNLGTIATAGEYISGLKVTFHDDIAAPIIKARADAITKRKSATEQADKVFTKVSLDGVEKETWQSLWEEARKYSEHSAYHGLAFPSTGEMSSVISKWLKFRHRRKIHCQKFEHPKVRACVARPRDGKAPKST
jgi:hypothetical protein